MNNQNNCQNRSEEITALVMGLLEPKAAEELRYHIETCSNCRKLYQTMLNEEKEVCSTFNAIADKSYVLSKKISEKSNKTTTIIWSRILTNPVVKFAAAAVIIIVIVLLSQNGSVNITSPAFGLEDIYNAIENIQWIHSTNTITEMSGDVEGEKQVGDGWENWESINPYIYVEKHTNGVVYFRERTEKGIKKYTYNPSSSEPNIITTEYATSYSSEIHVFNIDSLNVELRKLEKEGAKIEYEEVVFKGEPATNITIDIIPKEGDDYHSIISIIVDPDTYLPKKMEWQQTALNKNLTGKMVSIFDYPESGPMDIYEAGAPHDAKIIEIETVDNRDNTDLIEVLEPYNDARNNFASNYILITTYQYGSSIRSLEVIYNQAKKQRGEYRPVWGPVVNEDDLIAYKAALGDSFESLLKWSQGYENSMGRNLSIDIYNGQYLYRAEKSPSDKWTIHEQQHWPDYNPISLNDLTDWGWPRILARNNVTLIENDFSREAGFLTFERISEPAIREGKLVQPAEKVIYYLDPIHDYICVREENFSHAIRGYIDIQEVNFDINEIPEEPGSVQLVSEFGQTDTGQWYPKKIEKYSKSLDAGGNEKPLSLSVVNTLYLKTNPEFPEGIFDPNSLPKAD